MKIKPVDEYIALLEDSQKEWTVSMVNFMREVFPDVEETIRNKIPTYSGDGHFIAFAAQKNYFTFHTDDMMALTLIKELIPSASMGKGCARIKYNDGSAIEYLMDACKEIVDHHKSMQSPAVTDMKALKKWSKQWNRCGKHLLTPGTAYRRRKRSHERREGISMAAPL